MWQTQIVPVLSGDDFKKPINKVSYMVVETHEIPQIEFHVEHFE